MLIEMLLKMLDNHVLKLMRYNVLNLDKLDKVLNQIHMNLDKAIIMVIKTLDVNIHKWYLKMLGKHVLKRIRCKVIKLKIDMICDQIHIKSTGLCKRSCSAIKMLDVNMHKLHQWCLFFKMLAKSLLGLKHYKTLKFKLNKLHKIPPFIIKMFKAFIKILNAIS